MGGACSACKGRSEEPKKKSAIQVIKEEGNRIPRIWYEPTESGGIHATPRDTGFRRAADGERALHGEEEEEKSRLAEWRAQQLAKAADEAKRTAENAKLQQVSKFLTEEEERVAEARQIIAEYDAKKAAEEKERKEAERVARAREIHEAENNRLVKEKAAQRAISQAKTTNAQDIVEEAKEKTSKWIDSTS